MGYTPVEPSRLGTVAWPASDVERYVALGYWEGRSLGEHLYASDIGDDTDLDAICLVDGQTRLPFRDLRARADGAALRLHGLGLAPDDRVVVQLPNCWQFVVFMVACFRLGVIPVTALLAHRQQEIGAIAKHVMARALVVLDRAKDFELQAMAHDIAARTPTVEHVLVLGDTRLGSIDLATILEPAENPTLARKELDSITPDATSVAFFFLSGGTTGAPKLIARTHNDVAYMAKRAAQICQVGPHSTYLAALPLGHGFPMTGPGVLGTLMAGGRAVIAASPAPERAFELIERERVTITSLVPAAIGRWLEYRQAQPHVDLSSLRLLQSGGSRLPDELARRVTPVLGCTLQQVYGMSEGLLCMTRPDDPPDVLLHTQGRPICPHDELRLVDEDGRPVRDGEPGILLTRGPYTPRGYYRAAELNRHAFIGDGWYSTGDIVRIRRDGNLLVEGREKDVVNRGGEKIPAEEVENGAYLDPSVRLAAAVAMPDPVLGERICLYVVPHDGTTVTLHQIRVAMTAAGVAAFKLPEHLVEVTDLPYTNVGKVDKKALRADLARRLTGASGGG